jgi:hypothetical protein
MTIDYHACENGYPYLAMDHNGTLICLILLIFQDEYYLIRKIRAICVLFALERVE